MTIIVRDLMIGNPELEEMGFGEESMGYNAIAADFQGQRRWTDHFPNGDFMEVVERVTGEELTGKAENGIIHLINSGSAALDRTGQQQKDGKPVMNN